MLVPRAAQALARRAGQASRGTAGLGPEAHPFGRWQGELVPSLSQEHPTTLGATGLPGCALIIINHTRRGSPPSLPFIFSTLLSSATDRQDGGVILLALTGFTNLW
jgi:hypothetical protein